MSIYHLGFQHMMPNYRSFEIHRFTGEQDALEGTFALGKIESAIPIPEQSSAGLSVQFKSREKLIRDWWHDARSANRSSGVVGPGSLPKEAPNRLPYCQSLHEGSGSLTSVQRTDSRGCIVVFPAHPHPSASGGDGIGSKDDNSSLRTQ